MILSATGPLQALSHLTAHTLMLNLTGRSAARALCETPQRLKTESLVLWGLIHGEPKMRELLNWSLNSMRHLPYPVSDLMFGAGTTALILVTELSTPPIPELPGLLMVLPSTTPILEAARGSPLILTSALQFL